MDIDELTDRVAERIGFPVEPDEVVEEFGDEPVETGDSAESVTLRELLLGKPADAPGMAEEKDPEEVTPEQFRNRSHMNSHLRSFRD